MALEGRRRGERRIHPHFRVRVDYAHAVRAYEDHPILLREVLQRLLPCLPDGPDFTESRRDHDEPANALLPTLLNDPLDEVRGDHDDREIHGVRDIEDAWVRLDPPNGIGLRIHGEELALVLVHDEVPHDGVPDLSPVAGRADDRDGSGIEGRPEPVGHGNVSSRVTLLNVSAYDLSGERIPGGPRFPAHEPGSVRAAS